MARNIPRARSLGHRDRYLVLSRAMESKGPVKLSFQALIFLRSGLRLWIRAGGSLQGEPSATFAFSLLALRRLFGSSHQHWRLSTHFRVIGTPRTLTTFMDCTGLFSLTVVCLRGIVTRGDKMFLVCILTLSSFLTS